MCFRNELSSLAEVSLYLIAGVRLLSVRMDVWLAPAYRFYSGSYEFPCDGAKIRELHSSRKPEKFGLQLGELLL